VTSDDKSRHIRCKKQLTEYGEQVGRDPSRSEGARLWDDASLAKTVNQNYVAATERWSAK
jgi:hypothetical protein